MKRENDKFIEVHFTPSSVDETSLSDKYVVVIDVLRSASSIIVALSNGAREVIPAGDMGNAYKVFSNLTREVTLRCGEHNNKMIEGFDLGNSPLSYTEEKVRGKTIVMLTTNGTAAMVKARYSKSLLVASFLNLSAVLSVMKSWQSNITIVCSGQDNRFSLEDTICAGKIVSELVRENDSYQLDDSARSAVALDKSFGGNVLKMLKHSDHGSHLAKLGFEEDLKFCATLDSIPVIPILSGGVIKLAEQQPHLKIAN